MNDTYDPAVPNGMGQLGSVANAYSVTNFTNFDAAGRILGSSQVTGGRKYSFSYGYNLAGALTSETHPSGRVVSTGYDGANRPVTVAGNLSGQQSSY